MRVAKKEVMKLKHKFPVVSCAMRQDGMECATSGVDGIVRTWDLRNATRYYETTKEEVRERLAKEDLLNLDTKMTTLTMKNGHADIVTGLAYTCPDGFEIASVGMDGKCNLFDVKPFQKTPIKESKNIQRRPNGFRKANYQVRDELSFTLQ